MAHAHHHEGRSGNGNGIQNWLLSRTGIATIVALSVLGFLVYTGHSAHLLGLLPYLLILACPLMHIFMHGGHGGHRHDDREEEDEPAQDNEQQHNHSKGGCH